MKGVGNRSMAGKGDFFMEFVPVFVEQGEVGMKMLEVWYWGRDFPEGLVEGGLVGFATENLEEGSKTPERKTQDDVCSCTQKEQVMQTNDRKGFQSRAHDLWYERVILIKMFVEEGEKDQENRLEERLVLEQKKKRQRGNEK